MSTSTLPVIAATFLLLMAEPIFPGSIPAVLSGRGNPSSRFDGNRRRVDYVEEENLCRE